MAAHKHICSLSALPDSNVQLKKPRSIINNTITSCRRLTLVSSNNNQSKLYFRTRTAIELEIKRHLNSNFPFIIHPFSMFRLYWECWMLFVFFCALILNPFEMAFFPTYYCTCLTIILVIIDVICILDIILTFFTGYANIATKNVLLDPLMIAKKYTHSPYFYLNVLSSLPIGLICISNSSKPMFVNFISLFKVFRFHPFFIYMYRAIDRWQSSLLTGLITLVSIVIVIILHWITCMLYVLPHVKKLAKENGGFYWTEIGSSKLDHTNSLIFMYVQGFFRACCFFFNVGMAVEISTSYFDVIIDIITVITGYIVTAFLLILILQFISSGLSADSKYQEIMNQVHEYMRYKQLPCNIQNRLLTYYEYKFKKKYFREDIITATLSVRLRREINVYQFRRLIDSVSLFKGIPHQVVVDIVNCLKPEIYLPNDVIVKASTIGDCMYFLSSGTVCVTTPTGREVCHLYDGAYFGEVALIMKDQKRIANVYALEICEVYRLDRKHFKTCCMYNTQFCKKLEKIAEERREQTALLEDLQKQYLISLDNSKV